MKKIYLLLFIGFFTLSCATLFGPKQHSLSFNSNPNGADVFVNGEKMGVTPLRLELKPDRNYQIEFRRDGYYPITRIVNKKVGIQWIVLDLMGGVVPIIVDAATGNWYEFDQEYIQANLSKN